MGLQAALTTAQCEAHEIKLQLVRTCALFDTKSFVNDN
jgi:hypothetical protein